MKIPYTDLIPTVKAYFKTIWQDQWDSSTDFLSIISPSIGRKVYDPGLTRREQVVLCRIRLNHTRLTNSYRMSKERPPTCDHCQLPMTMNHIMVNCNKYRHLREEHLRGSTPEEIYGNADRDIITFIKECGLFQDI